MFKSLLVLLIFFSLSSSYCEELKPMYQESPYMINDRCKRIRAEIDFLGFSLEELELKLSDKSLERDFDEIFFFIESITILVGP